MDEEERAFIIAAIDEKAKEDEKNRKETERQAKRHKRR